MASRSPSLDPILPTLHSTANGRMEIRWKLNYRCAPRWSACPTVRIGWQFCAPILLAAPAGTNDLPGLYANDSRMGHVARRPVSSLDQIPVLLASARRICLVVRPDPAAGPFPARRCCRANRIRWTAAIPVLPFGGCALPDVLATDQANSRPSRKGLRPRSAPQRCAEAGHAGPDCPWGTATGSGTRLHGPEQRLRFAGGPALAAGEWFTAVSALVAKSPMELSVSLTGAAMPGVPTTSWSMASCW